ncbi:MAG: hotdog fold thioesterase [Bacteroidetes bacterium]|nr:MAG: hotdog fold thioesterase [Bacteroidota bacterium]
MKDPIWKQRFTPEQVNSLRKNTINEVLGIELVEIGPDYITARMPVDHRTHQNYGMLHGGASVVLAETLGSVASTACLEDLQSQMAVGVEINANHLRSVKSGFVTGTVRPVKVGRTIHVWSISIRDEQGREVCVSRITVAIVPVKT